MISVVKTVPITLTAELDSKHDQEASKRNLQQGQLLEERGARPQLPLTLS